MFQKEIGHRGLNAITGKVSVHSSAVSDCDKLHTPLLPCMAHKIPVQL